MADTTGRLTPREARLAHEYLRLGSAAAAARAAGYSPETADARAHEIIRRPRVAEEIARLQARAAALADLDRGVAVRELARVATASIADVCEWHTPRSGRPVLRVRDTAEISPDALAAIAEIQQTREGLRVRMHGKMAALDSLISAQGWARSSSGPTATPADAEERARLARAVLDALGRRDPDVIDIPSGGHQDDTSPSHS